MCESDAYLKKGNSEEFYFKDVVSIRPVSDNELLIQGLTGEQKKFRGRISRIDLVAHKIWLEPQK